MYMYSTCVHLYCTCTCICVFYTMCLTSDQLKNYYTCTCLHDCVCTLCMCACIMYTSLNYIYMYAVFTLFVVQTDIPTTIGVGLGEEGVAMETDKADSNVKTSKKYFIDNTFIHRPRENVEMKNPLRDGMG